jgi:hypothetical protein
MLSEQELQAMRARDEALKGTFINMPLRSGKNLTLHAINDRHALLAHIDAQAKRIEESEAERAVLAEAIDSAGKAIAFSSADWGADKRQAWVYGIILGWDRDDDGEETAMGELAAKFGWDEANVARLRKYHKAIAALRKEGNA